MSLIRLCWLVMFPFPGSFQLDGFAFVLFFCSAFCSSKQLQMLCSLFLVLGEGKAVSESCSTKAECRRLLPRRCFYCANTVVSFISLMLQIPMWRFWLLMYFGVCKQKVMEGKSSSCTCLHWEFFSLSDIGNCFFFFLLESFWSMQNIKWESWDIFNIYICLYVKNITKGDDCGGILH